MADGRHLEKVKSPLISVATSLRNEGERIYKHTQNKDRPLLLRIVNGDLMII